MASRLDLQAKLEQLLGTRRVYFQAPEGIKLSYPCIIYDLSSQQVLHANDKIYKRKKRYSVTIIDTNYDSEIPDTILFGLEYCSFDRHFVSDNIHHFVYTVYY